MPVIYTDSLSTLRHGDVRDELRAMPAQSVHCVVTSPPYWALRDYNLPPSVWGGSPDCDHQWGQVERHAKANDIPGPNSGGKNEHRNTTKEAGQSCRLCGAWCGCLGLEPTPDLFIAHMTEVLAEVWRVLRDDGVCWINIGDSMFGSGKGQNSDGVWNHGMNSAKQATNAGSLTGVPTKGIIPGLKPLDMVGIPWRLAFALQAQGWYLRSDVIFHKPNPMPESVGSWKWEQHRVKVKAAVEDWREDGRERSGVVETAVNHVSGGNTGFTGQRAEWKDCPGCRVCTPNDGLVLRKGAWRPTKSHEYLFMMTKSPEYYCDMEAVREVGAGRLDLGNMNSPARLNQGGEWTNTEKVFGGRNRRSVWTIPTQPRPDLHFASFPDALVEPCILASTSEHGCCPQCGAPYVRVVEVTEEYAAMLGKGWHDHKNDVKEGQKSPPQPPAERTRTLGWRASCGCKDAGEPVPCTVCDPFVGSGTTVQVAKRLVRRGVGIDASETYLREIAVPRMQGQAAGFQLGGMLD